MKRSGFKMKYSPAKGILGDFFSSLGKQLKRNRKDIGGEFKGVKQKDKARMLENRADAEYYGSAKDKAKNSEANRIKPKSKPESKAYVPQEFKGKAGDKFRYRKTGEYGKSNEFTSFEFMKPGSETWTKAEPVDGDYSGKNRINDLFAERRDADELFDSPIDKKSPTKKKGFKMPGHGKRK